MSAPIHWPSTITYTVDATLAFDPSAIERALAGWQSVLPYSFLRVAMHGQFVMAPLADVLHAFRIDWSPVALNVTVADTAAATGMASYIGLDLERALLDGWEPWVLVLHEIGHAFGLADRPAATGSESLYGYAAPHPAGLTADAIEFVQAGLGSSPRDDRIAVTGSAAGRIRGGPGRDTVVAGAGDEVIYGNRHGDHLLGGAGDDTVYGGQDDDRIAGGDSADVLYGNLGGDTLSGGPGPDRLYGGQGDDVIHAGAGDTVWGGRGADTIWAHPLTVIGQHDPLDSILFVGM